MKAGVAVGAGRFRPEDCSHKVTRQMISLLTLAKADPKVAREA